MNVKLTTNTMILWSAYHARTSPEYWFFGKKNEKNFFSEWDAIKVKCKTTGARDVDEYDFMVGNLAGTLRDPKRNPKEL